MSVNAPDQLREAGSDSITLLSVNIRVSPTATTLRSLCGILDTCGVTNPVKICDHNLSHDRQQAPCQSGRAYWGCISSTVEIT